MDENRDYRPIARLNQLMPHIPEPQSSPISTTHPQGEVASMHSERNQELEKGKLDPRSSLFIGKPMSLLHEIAFLAVVSTANFCPQAGMYQAISILHIMGDSLGTTGSADLVWLIAGYSLTCGTFILLAGRLGDVYGHKLMFIAGNVWFALWSWLVGLSVLAPNAYALFVVARVLQGTGAALCIPNAVALLGVTYAPGPRKAMVFSIFGAVAPVAAIVSPAFSGLFALYWWPWTYWAFAIVLAVIAIAGFFIVPDESTPRAKAPRGFREVVDKLDLLGTFTGITGLALISFSWSQGALVGWHHPYVYVLLIVGVLFFTAFFFVEQYAANPLIPKEFLTSGVAYVLTAVACGWGCFGIWVYYAWEFYEVLRGASPLLATAWHSPVLVCGVIASIVTGMIITKVGPAPVMALALLAFTVGTVLLATAPIDQTYWTQTFFCNLIITWGMDLSFPAATLMLSDLASVSNQGIAASLVTTVLNYSASLFLGVAGTVEVHVNNGGLTPEDVLKGYRGGWYVAIGLGVVGLIVSLVYVWQVSRRSRR